MGVLTIIYDTIVNYYGNQADATANRRGITGAGDRNAFSHAYISALDATTG